MTIRGKLIDEFIRYAKGFSKVWFARRIEIANWCLEKGYENSAGVQDKPFDIFSRLALNRLHFIELVGVTMVLSEAVERLARQEPASAL